jgi:gamma-D-glutamyl-L-lysine dipeptidyl-peptidase
MSSIVTTAAAAPLSVQPSVRAEQCNQLVLGDTAAIVRRENEWLSICTHRDDYAGWIHSGYVRVIEDSEAASWRADATAWSEGAVVRAAHWQVHLPLLARVAMEGDVVVLPDGRRGRTVAGSLRRQSEVISAARAKAPERWASEHFAGTPYQWGGVTPWGADCSGLVQTTFAARGTKLPRDAAQQVAVGSPISPDAIRPGDLLFFRSESGAVNITHVAFAAEADTLLHSTLACGGVVAESWLPGSRAAGLRERLVAVRRLEER